MTVSSKNELLARLAEVDQIPSIPVVVAPLLRSLEQPLDQLDLHKVVDQLSQDKFLTAQCLHMANSPLWGHWQKVDSLRNAVVALGFQRLREIIISCSILKLVPGKAQIDPIVFWEHSLGCALVSRQFARRVNFATPDKAYLGGLLHDIGHHRKFLVTATGIQSCTRYGPEATHPSARGRIRSAWPHSL